SAPSRGARARLGPTRRARTAVAPTGLVMAETVGVFGGSGFYSFLDGAEQVEVDTPYGPPSAPPAVAELGGQRVAFISRHGRAHEYPPHRIPFRANVWAMRELGVRRILGPCA